MKKIIGLTLIGLTIPGIIFTGLMYLSYEGVYGELGIGQYNHFIPLILSIVILVLGLFLFFTSREKVF